MPETIQSLLKLSPSKLKSVRKIMDIYKLRGVARFSISSHTLYEKAHSLLVKQFTLMVKLRCRLDHSASMGSNSGWETVNRESIIIFYCPAFPRLQETL
jgi:hypothetical protein